MAATKQKESAKTKFVNIRDFPVTVWLRAKSAAAGEGITLAAWLSRAIERELKQKAA